MQDRNNLNLFWYGVFANVKKFFGGSFLVLSTICGSAYLLEQNIVALIFTFLFLIFGGYLLVKGYSQRFDYKMQSGYMVHRGD